MSRAESSEEGSLSGVMFPGSLDLPAFSSSGGHCSTMMTAQGLRANWVATFHIVFRCLGINIPSLLQLH